MDIKALRNKYKVDMTQFDKGNSQTNQPVKPRIEEKAGINGSFNHNKRKLTRKK